MALSVIGTSHKYAILSSFRWIFMCVLQNLEPGIGAPFSVPSETFSESSSNSCNTPVWCLYLFKILFSKTRWGGSLGILAVSRSLTKTFKDLFNLLKHFWWKKEKNPDLEMDHCWKYSLESKNHTALFWFKIMKKLSVGLALHRFSRGLWKIIWSKFLVFAQEETSILSLLLQNDKGLDLMLGIFSMVQ